ncbi:hypothetical protein ACFL2V_20445 [Pseudomonadota bacterium]
MADSTEKVKVEKKTHRAEDLLYECDLISSGMHLSEVDSLINSKNRRTKSTGSKGGHVKYWISHSPAEYLPGGEICKVDFDKNEIVSNIEKLNLSRTLKSP